MTDETKSIKLHSIDFSTVNGGLEESEATKIQCNETSKGGRTYRIHFAGTRNP